MHSYPHRYHQVARRPCWSFVLFLISSSVVAYRKINCTTRGGEAVIAIPIKDIITAKLYFASPALRHCSPHCCKFPQREILRVGGLGGLAKSAKRNYYIIVVFPIPFFFCYPPSGGHITLANRVTQQTNNNQKPARDRGSHKPTHYYDCNNSSISIFPFPYGILLIPLFLLPQLVMVIHSWK